ncbi:hypothetical protein [Celerinatantimonas sp. MCCC 1A17872]|uniref:hypothetical protein n=1 Tax=Celerinatantimonas sp. MCCC 1A17872 TaxID=3177514 RepID=UPI0038BECA5B
MIPDGIYHIVFTGSHGVGGQGILTINNGSINGGDFGYLYQGYIKESNLKLTAQVGIFKFFDSAQSIFGPLEKFDLMLTGEETGQHSFTLSGYVMDHPELEISIKSFFLKDLV